MTKSKPIGSWYDGIAAAAERRPALCAVLVTAATVCARLLIEAAVHDVVPYALVFIAVTIATLLAGARCGALTIILCQTLIWIYVVPRVDGTIGTPAQIVSLVLTTLSQAVIVFSLGMYRGMADERLRRERLERQNAELALRELDHRTKNSFQLATSVLRARARHIDMPELRLELDRAAQRLISLEAAHSNDAVSRGTATTIALDAYVDNMVQRLGEGLDGIELVFATDVPPLIVPRRVAISLGLILNEAIFNSVKHAFGCGGGVITIGATCRADMLTVEILDNGPGFSGDDGNGTRGIGGRMIEALARSIEATVTRLPGPGAGYRITLPLDACAEPERAVAAPRRWLGVQTRVAMP